MGKKYSTMLIIVVSVIAVIGIAVGVSFAIWTSGTSTPIPQDSATIGVINTTAKYLVFEVYDETTNDFAYVRYHVSQKEIPVVPEPSTGPATVTVDEGYFEYSQVDKDRYKDKDCVLETDFTQEKIANLSARVVGFVDSYKYGNEYKGYALGEVETVEIPNTIPVKLNGNIRAEVPVKEINMQSPEEFKPLLYIRSVKIPKSVLKIDGVSFTGCRNLKQIEYETGSTLTAENVGVNCFRGCLESRDKFLPKPGV